MGKLYLEPFKRIKKNRLLRADEPSMDLDAFIRIRSIAPIDNNLSIVEESTARKIYSKYGAEGLFKLVLLTQKEGNDFDCFYKAIKSAVDSICLFDDFEDLQLDNNRIAVDESIKKFNVHLFQPSFSRKIYNPGCGHGYLVYGIDGPRILVSHPFHGINSEIETYDIHRDALDVFASLGIRGYFGSFLFLDYFQGLNYKVHGIPAWVLWFSYIANNSDLVIYIKDKEQGFTEAQKMELKYVSNSIPKKIVEIPHSELSWAVKPEASCTKVIYLGPNGEMSQEEFGAIESEFAKPFIDLFANSDLKKDKYIVLNENHTVTEYSLNYEIYV